MKKKLCCPPPRAGCCQPNCPHCKRGCPCQTRKRGDEEFADAGRAERDAEWRKALGVAHLSIGTETDMVEAHDTGVKRAEREAATFYVEAWLVKNGYSMVSFGSLITALRAGRS